MVSLLRPIICLSRLKLFAVLILPALLALPPASQPVKTLQINSMDQRDSIVAALRLWAKVWAAGDTDRYLGMYSASFVPADGALRQQWERTRRQRIGGAREIVIDIADLRIVQVNQTRTEAAFVRHFAARGMREETRKKLTLEKVADDWKIISEQGVKIPHKQE